MAAKLSAKVINKPMAAMRRNNQKRQSLLYGNDGENGNI
jgi:hypothetical protein